MAGLSTRFCACICRLLYTDLAPNLETISLYTPELMDCFIRLRATSGTVLRAPALAALHLRSETLVLMPERFTLSRLSVLELVYERPPSSPSTLEWRKLRVLLAQCPFLQRMRLRLTIVEDTQEWERWPYRELTFPLLHELDLSFRSLDATAALTNHVIRGLSAPNLEKLCLSTIPDAMSLSRFEAKYPALRMISFRDPSLGAPIYFLSAEPRYFLNETLTSNPILPNLRTLNIRELGGWRDGRFCSLSASLVQKLLETRIAQGKPLEKLYLADREIDRFRHLGRFVELTNSCPREEPWMEV